MMLVLSMHYSKLDVIYKCIIWKGCLGEGRSAIRISSSKFADQLNYHNNKKYYKNIIAPFQTFRQTIEVL